MLPSLQKRNIEKLKDKLDRETEKFNKERLDRETEVSCCSEQYGIYLHFEFVHITPGRVRSVFTKLSRILV